MHECCSPTQRWFSDNNNQDVQPEQIKTGTPEHRLTTTPDLKQWFQTLSISGAWVRDVGIKKAQGVLSETCEERAAGAPVPQPVGEGQGGEATPVVQLGLLATSAASLLREGIQLFFWSLRPNL